MHLCLKVLGEFYVITQPPSLRLPLPPGRGGVGVIRLSGPKAYAIADSLNPKSTYQKHVMLVSVSFTMLASEVMDEGLVICFPIHIHLPVKMWWSYKGMVAQ